MKGPSISLADLSSCGCHMALAKCILSSGFVRLWLNAEMYFFICAKQKSWSLSRILHFNFIVCVIHVMAGAQVGATALV